MPSMRIAASTAAIAARAASVVAGHTRNPKPKRNVRQDSRCEAMRAVSSAVSMFSPAIFTGTSCPVCSTWGEAAGGKDQVADILRRTQHGPQDDGRGQHLLLGCGSGLAAGGSGCSRWRRTGSGEGTKTPFRMPADERPKSLGVGRPACDSFAEPRSFSASGRSVPSGLWRAPGPSREAGSLRTHDRLRSEAEARFLIR
jgi:hypothetical protein